MAAREVFMNCDYSGIIPKGLRSNKEFNKIERKLPEMVIGFA